jgi:hypothetical protein
MSESKAVRFFRVPPDVMDLLSRDGAPVPYPFAGFFLEFVLPRLPNKTTEQNAILQRLLAVFSEGRTESEHELHANEWQALNDAMPQLGDQKTPAITVPVYMKTQCFYAAVFSAPTTKPKNWGPKDEPAHEPMPVEEAAQ